MKKLFALISVLFVITINAKAQKNELAKIADSIKAEGEMLYRSEWASGHATAIFKLKYPTKKLLSGGYLSYETKKGLTTIFFSTNEDPVVVATVKFRNGLDLSNYSIDTITRKFTENEKEFYTIRAEAAKDVLNDPLFQFYDHTSLNLIPVIKGGEKRVYVITAQTSPNEVLLGNDYLITFDKDNNIIKKTKLHNNLIPLGTGGEDPIKASSHQHLGETSPFITATDVCAFKMWKGKTTWVISFVSSIRYVSAWHFQDEFLEILTQDEFQEIMKKNQ
ncbi:hypothetical protein [Mucilaginibacter sp. L3T2-6]|uniref:hypothetical protein n=1 Tax=Mucilaginibacter sp. L3T2-6 TaxID=3062491 RepID=UPI002675EAA0|nr:hypothetical protein [Mucilaginibacter sp. L3T2-6]MDO3641423.1 hypothetical protein [Mucilaginibacter sp. L3T2-6]MDV6213816.1 hypothetical protein [Mucilaginibacter sp. L3T2-6]